MYEQKDIQYHENMKAQKASLKKLRSRREKNVKDIEEKGKLNKQMEDSLTQYDEEIEKAKKEKEACEKQLNNLLSKYKEEIDRLKEKRAEIEVCIDNNCSIDFITTITREIFCRSSCY